MHFIVAHHWKKISIPNSITNIGDNAFYNCTSLKSITIPNSVRSIGSRSFAVCNSLETVDIRGNISRISEYTFAKCKMLKSVKLPNSITEIEANAFASCTSIESFTIPDSVQIIGERAFYECSALQNIAIPFSVFAIDESAFLKCNKLTNAKIPARLCKFIAKRKIFEDTCNKQYVDNIFEYKGSKLVLLPNAANNGFTISEFINIPNDGVVTIPPTAYGKPITSMDDNVFKSHSNNLVKVNFEKDCNISYIGNKVFRDCHKLKEVNISTHYTTFSKGAFANCSSLKTANVHADLKEKMENMFPTTCTVNYTSDGFIQRLFGKKYATQASEIERKVTKNSCEFKIAETPDGITITGLTKMSKNGIVKIPSEIDGKPIVKLDESAFESSDIKQISFDKGCQISSISAAAFIHCTSLESIILPDSIVSIDKFAFLECQNLKSIIIPDSVTSIGESAFAGCSNLTTIKLSNNLVSIGKTAFANCNSLTSITIPASVTSIGKWAFLDFSDSQTIFIADGSKITNIADNAFENCKATVSIPESLKDKINWSIIKNIKVNIRQEKCEFTASSVYKRIDSITKIPASGIVTIPSKMFGNYVEKINKDIFKDNTDIKEIIFEDDCQIKNINKVSFEGCNATISIPESLKDRIQAETNVKVRPNKCVFGTRELDDGTVAITGIKKVPYDGIVTIPSHIDGKAVVSIDDDTFRDLEEIKKVKFEDDCQIKNIGKNAFYCCTNLESIVLPDSITSISNRAFFKCSNLTSINLPNNIVSIGTHAFASCTNLKSINIPSKVTYIDVGTFSDCSNITSINIPDNVTSIRKWAFNGCSKLQMVYISNDSKLNSIHDNAFEGCSASISIPENLADKIKGKNINIRQGNCTFKIIESDENGVTITGIDKIPHNGIITIPSQIDGKAVVSIGNDAFKNHKEIKEVKFEDGCQIKNIDKNAFTGCSNLANIIIPNSVTSIGESAFAGCSNLININLDNVTSIGSAAFADCSNLKNINIDKATSIGEKSFKGCSNLKSITLDNVTSIGKAAFEGCSNLKHIPIDNVTSIGEKAFKGCSNLKSINLNNVTSIIGKSTFEGCSNLDNISISKATSIDGYAFEGCSNLKRIIVPECVTSIHPDAFSNCPNLKQITILPDTKLSETQIDNIRGRYPNVEVFVVD